MVAAEGVPVSAACRLYEPFPQLLRNVDYRGGDPLGEASVQAAIAAAEKRLGAEGRLVIRPSGTEPLIRVMAEAPDAALVASVVGEICAAIKAAAR